MTKKEIFYHTALSLIHKKGFKSMTMRDLASELSCNIKNLYNYTASKSSLLEELLFDIANDFHTGIDAIRDSGLDAGRQLEELIRLHIEFSFSKPTHVALLVNDWRNLEPEKLVEFKNNRSDYEYKVAGILSKGVAEGKFKKTNIKIAQHYVLGSLRWLYEYASEDENPPNTLTVFEELKSYILPGLCANS